MFNHLNVGGLLIMGTRVAKVICSIVLLGTFGFWLMRDLQSLNRLLQKQSWAKGLIEEQKAVKNKAMMVTINHYRPDLSLWKDFVLNKTVPDQRFLKENVQYYELIGQYFPQSAESDHLLGVAYELLGERNKAIQQYQKLLLLDPHFFYGWYNLAGLLAQEGRSREATEAYQKALQCDPQQTMARVTTSRIYVELIKLMGLNAQDIVGQMKGSYREAYDSLGRVLEAIKDPQQSLEGQKFTPRIF